MPAHHNGIIHAIPGDRVSTWPATSQQLAEWLDENAVRHSDMPEYLEDVASFEAIPLGTTHLDSVVEPDDYTQSLSAQATLERGYPLGLAGLLQVRANAERRMVYQFYTVYIADHGHFVRTCYKDEWTDWIELSQTGHHHALGDVDGLQAALDSKANADLEARITQVEYQSGLRDITALAPSRAAGAIYVYRSGPSVTLIFWGYDNGGSDTVMTLPYGFRPAYTIPWTNSETFALVGRMLIHATGLTRMLGGLPTDAQLWGSVTYTTLNSVPASEPGDPG